MQWSSLNLDVLIVDSVLEISLASRCHPIIEEEVKVLEVVKYIKDNKHDGKSKATTIENEKFVDDNNVGGLWILCGGFVPIYKEALSVQEFVAPNVKPLGINLHVKLCQTRSDSFNKEILEIEGCYMDKMNVGIQCWLEIILVEMLMKFGLVSWTCGSAFWYAIIRWCDRNEVYDEPTIDNLGDTWAEKVQPNHTTLFLDFSICNYNSHTVKRIHVSRMIIGYDVVISASLFVRNVAIIIRWRKLRLDLAKWKILLLYSSVLRIAWDPGKSNVCLSKAAYEFYWRFVFISHGACIRFVVEPYDLALWNTVIWGYVSERNFVLPFNMMSWHSSFLVKQQYLIEFNFPMVVAADNEVCWRMFFIFRGLLNFVFDRGKFCSM
jgi:hypothetical protein